MRIMAQMAVIGALIAGATALNAQTTNIDVNVNISLNGVVQTGDTSSRGRISTKDVIQAVAPGASARAKLVLRTVPGGGDPIFVVRDAGTDTEIGAGTLSTARVGDAVVVTADRNGVTVEKVAEIRRFVLNTGTISFDVQGYTTSTSDNKGLRGTIFESTSVVSASAKVSGSMVNSAGNPGVCQGTISMSGRKITEVP